MIKLRFFENRQLTQIIQQIPELSEPHHLKSEMA